MNPKYILAILLILIGGGFYFMAENRRKLNQQAQSIDKALDLAEQYLKNSKSQPNGNTESPATSG